jgi:thiol:disulfide interchange protein DsbD
MDFTAEWCAACRLLDRNTLTDAVVVDESRRFVTLRIDMSNEGEPTKELERRFGVATLPTVIFVDSRGGILNSLRVTGFVAPKAFVEAMRAVR